MSKGLSQMSRTERSAAIARRIRVDAGGLGTLAAQDAVRKIEKGIKEVVDALATVKEPD